jgi:hypothetical protein
MDRKFTVIDEITKSYRRFNTVGTQLTVRLLPPPVGLKETLFPILWQVLPTYASMHYKIATIRTW